MQHASRRDSDTHIRPGTTLVALAVGWLCFADSPPPSAHANPPGQASDWTCVPEGRTCTFGSDCCSKSCVDDPKLGKVCKPSKSTWTCKPEGTTCSFASDCCGKNCVDDPKLGKVCKPEGASWTCAPQGRSCSFASDCCSKHCVDDPRLGKVCKPPRK